LSATVVTVNVLSPAVVPVTPFTASAVLLWLAPLYDVLDPPSFGVVPNVAATDTVFDPVAGLWRSHTLVSTLSPPPMFI